MQSSSKPDSARLLLSEQGAAQYAADFPGEALFGGMQLFHAVRFLAQRMHEATAIWLAAYGLSPTKFHYLALLHLRRKKGLTAGEVAAAARTTSGSVTAMIDLLVRDGLVVRKESNLDSRRVIVKLTPKGSRLYLTCARARNAALIELAEKLGLDKVAALTSLLVETGNALHELSPDSGTARAKA